MTDAPSAPAAEPSDVEIAMRALLEYYGPNNTYLAALSAKIVLAALTRNGRAKLVRREPTKEMELAVMGNYDDGVSFTYWTYMWNAAPPYTGD